MSDEAMSPLAPMLRKLEYWANFSQSDREALLALPHSFKAIELGKMVVREGDKPTHSCLLRSGFLYRHKIVAEGARQIVAIHMSGDMVDLQNSLLGTADHNLQALTRAEVAFIPGEALQEIAFARPAMNGIRPAPRLISALSQKVARQKKQPASFLPQRCHPLSTIAACGGMQVSDVPRRPRGCRLDTLGRTHPEPF